MRSRVEARAFIEQVARAAALLLLAVALWRLVQAQRARAEPTVHVRLDGSESSVTRDSLGALARSGIAVRWSGTIPALAVMAEPVREPGERTRVAVVADAAVALVDSLGAIDSLSAGSGSIVVAGVHGAVSARVGQASARTGAAAAVAPGRVLVIGRAGWESKFVIAALEEEGWLVDAELAVSDTLSVRQGGGTSGAPRAETHAVVVVLDSTVRSASLITRFVQRGGGLVLAGEGAGARELRALAPARTVRAERARSRTFEGVDPMLALPLHALDDLRADALVLGRRDGRITSAARRVGAGRVVQAGYGETWRWRLEGGTGGVEAHRAYWSRLVGSVAAFAAPARPDVTDVTDVAGTEGAPLAATIFALGGASAPAAERAPGGAPLPAWLGALILALLLAEWASRRTRGLR